MFTKKKKSQRTTPLSADEIRTKLENFCAYRERCPKEVRLKLAELGATSEIATSVLESLLQDKFFDETRFAYAFASGKFRYNHWGKVRIRLELRQREIAPDTIQQAIEAIDEAEYDTLIGQLLQRKLAQYAEDEKGREKSAASLIRSGFEPELVFKKLNKFFK